MILKLIKSSHFIQEYGSLALIEEHKMFIFIADIGIEALARKAVPVRAVFIVEEELDVRGDLVLRGLEGLDCEFGLRLGVDEHPRVFVYV
jgi:hypothetical protein